MQKKGLKILSIFDGISCARVALERVGIEVDYYFASEIDKYAITISQKNYSDQIPLGDVRNVTKEKIEEYSMFCDIDLLIGGSPCQDLSIAKKDRKGLDGERSGLFWEYVRILKEVKPKYFILENVNSMPKEAKELITKTLGVESIMINASLVSAQNRKRLFWTNIPNVTQPEDRGILLKDILESGDSDRLKSYCIDANYAKGANWKQYIEKGRRQLVRIGSLNSGGQGDRIYSPDGKSIALATNSGGTGSKTGLYAVALTETRTEKAKRIRSEHYKKTGKDWSPRFEKELVPRQDEKANTITTGNTKESLILENTTIRKLTPIECERLQSLPDNYTQYGTGLQKDNMFDNIDIWKNVLSKIATGKKKPISEHALCITKDTRDIELLNCLSEQKKNVYIAIDFQLQGNSATNIIKIGIGTKTHFLQIKCEKKQGTPLIDMDIKEGQLTELNTEILWKGISKGNLEDTKLFIISILSKLIIQLETCISVQNLNTNYYIVNLNKLLLNSSSVGLYDFQKGNIQLISNTQRYKCLGNAFNVDVVAHILSQLSKTMI